MLHTIQNTPPTVKAPDEEPICDLNKQNIIHNSLSTISDTQAKKGLICHKKIKTNNLKRQIFAISGTDTRQLEKC